MFLIIFWRLLRISVCLWIKQAKCDFWSNYFLLLNSIKLLSVQNCLFVLGLVKCKLEFDHGMVCDRVDILWRSLVGLLNSFYTSIDDGTATIQPIFDCPGRWHRDFLLILRRRFACFDWWWWWWLLHLRFLLDRCVELLLLLCGAISLVVHEGDLEREYSPELVLCRIESFGIRQ